MSNTAPGTPSVDAYLLTRQWRDTPDGVEIVLWAKTADGPIRVRVDGQKPVFFVERGSLKETPAGAELRPLELFTLGGRAVDGLYFRTQREMVEARSRLRARGHRLHESDVRPTERFLMERFITGAFRVIGAPLPSRPGKAYREYVNPRFERTEFRPELSVVSLDIETGGFDDLLYSIGASRSEGGGRVFLLRHPDWRDSSMMARDEELVGDVELTVHASEAVLIEEFFSWLAHVDPDILIGWNVIDFDLDFLERKCAELNLGFAFGRGRDRATLLSPSGPASKRIARLPGRAVLDGIDTLRNATWSFEDFSLEAVARELLGRGKLIVDVDDDRLKEIRRLYREAPMELVSYNLSDCHLVEEIFAHAKLMDFVLERGQLTGLALDRVGGSVAAFDNLYLPRLHRRGYVARDVEDRSLEADEMSPGGYVMESVPGLFDNVLVLDFKSLYPSIIRTFLIDPLGLAQPGDDPVPGFDGGRFAREGFILPGLIDELWQARDRARRSGDEALSKAIKIIMNSFYGVLGTPGCRFFEPRLVASITRRGHEIITQSRDVIEDAGYRVIYGDTDSLFVLIGAGPDEAACFRTGAELRDRLNQHWRDKVRAELRLESRLEIEFETHYVRFFMPTMRRSERGSKKRYAGLVRRGAELELTFTGLETVRSDWTRLARQFQRELYGRIFRDEPFEAFIKRTAEELFAGRRDGDLVYRKRLRRKLSDYKKNVPPHAQAAKKSANPGRWIRYVVTRNGPEPLDNNPSPLDYQHYLDRQLAPAADALLQVKGTSVSRILDAQLSLF